VHKAQPCGTKASTERTSLSPAHMILRLAGVHPARFGRWRGHNRSGTCIKASSHRMPRV
jgi:hypothetical protein